MANETESSDNIIKEFLNTQLFNLSVQFYFVNTEYNISSKFKLLQQSVLNLLFKYLKKQEFMMKYLITLQCFTDLHRKAFSIFKKKILKYLVQNAELFRCKSKNMNI